MKQHRLNPHALPARPALALTLALSLASCGGSHDDAAKTAGDPIEGTWEAVVSARDCNTGAVLGTFSGSQIMHRGGTLSDTNGAPPTTRGPGYGVWSAGSSAGSYTARFRFFRYNTDGSMAGSNVVTRTIVLAADGNTHTATTEAEVRSLTGAVLQKTCASDVSTRFL